MSTVHPIDLSILVVFLVVTLIVGLRYGQQVKTIRDYALGGKNFSTSTLTATLVATWASGSDLFITLENTYSRGLYYIIARVGMPIGFLLSGWLAPRMGEFMNNVSVAEAMGDMYGKTVRIITAFCGILSKIGYTAVQFKVIATVFTVFFPIESKVASLLAAIILILYSAFGGVKAVTFTDVLQFLTFGAMIPVLALVIWNKLPNPSQVIHTLSSNPNFHFRKVVFSSQFIDTLSLLPFFMIPGLSSPEIFQRIAMARDSKQAKHALLYAAGGMLLTFLFLTWIGILLLTDKPGLAPGQVASYMIANHTYVGLKGLLAAGLIALAMSTADSCLNANAVLFANDIVKPLSKHPSSLVTNARLFSVVVGILSLIIALYSHELISLVVLAGSFYMPIYTVPMLMAILGFRTSTRAVFISMVAGLITVVLWNVLMKNTYSILAGMAANLIAFLGSHYLLGEPGGWQKVAPHSPLGLERAARKKALQRRIKAIKNFKLYPYLQQNLPQQEGLYSLVGLYTIAATYTAFYTIGDATIQAHREIYEGIYHTVLFATTAFLTFPIWPPTVKSYRFITFFWPLGMATLLFFAGTLLVILSNFHTMQMMVLMLNFLLAVLLLQWSLALILALSGISLAVLFFQQYTGESLPWSDVSSLQLQLLYGLLLFTSFLIVLFQGKQAYTKLDRKNEILTRLDQENQAGLLEASAKNRQALQALQNTRGEHLLTIAKDLQAIKLEGADAAHMQAIQTKLILMAFQLQVIANKAQDYLRLQIATLPIQQWLQSVQEKLREKGIEKGIHYKVDTQHQELRGDAECMTQLLVKSIAVLQASNKAQPVEEQRVVLVGLEDTLLHYSLPDVEQGYVKRVQALRVVVTTEPSFPALALNYEADLAASQATTPETTQALEQLTNDRIIKAHYGYAEVSPTTLFYVLPVNVKEVRPKDLDKPYMELWADAVRANDHFKNDQVDAQAQEQKFLAAVEQRSKADIGLVKIALELIKWYHGPVNRHSCEPFYLHPLAVAQIVLDYNTDEATVIGALLHDTIEDTSLLLHHLETVFGQETAEVVKVVTHLQSIPGSLYKVKLSAEENIRMLERTGNQQVLYVKLADRIHNIRTIEGHDSVEKQRSIAQETLAFFVPLAARLGLQQAGEELTERCFKVLKKQGEHNRAI